MEEATASAPAEQDASGWQEVEQTLTALELPPVPPTSDPQRLLGYVLHILPRYTEMEMLATHLRLYASTLEQDMEQIKSHVRLLTREAAGEREKKLFLERYAAQVVKERNDLLHSRGPSKKKNAAAASHFVWHNCCKKNTSHAMDLAPSILAFRGEKLQEATKQIEVLQEEVHNQELLRKELDFLLKKTQREHDSKVAADRQHIQQLEKQILQRTALHSSLERKLYEVESMLAKHDETKEEELSIVSDQIRKAQGRIETLENENASLHEQVRSLGSDRDCLSELLEETTESKNVFAEQIDELSEKCHSLESEVEALRSEIDMLQTKDINDVRSQFAAKIDRLQKDSAANEQKLRQEIDRVKQELMKKRDNALAQTVSARQSTARGSSRYPLSGQTSGLRSIPVSTDDPRWSDGIFDDDRHFESDAVGSSLSRSQLSDSRGSFDLSSSGGASHFNLSKDIDAANNGVSTRSCHGMKSRQSYASSSRHSNASELEALSRGLKSSSSELGTTMRENSADAITDHVTSTSYQRDASRKSYGRSSRRSEAKELDAISRALSMSSRELDTETHENDVDVSADEEPFDWETFIDSAPDMSTVQDQRTTQRSSAATLKPMDLSTSTIHHEDSIARIPDSDYAGSSRGSVTDIFVEDSRIKNASLHFSRSRQDASFSKSPSLTELDLAEDEEEKETDKDNSVGDDDHEQHPDHEKSIAQVEHAQNDLARDLFEMLNGLEQKRKEEEQKASQAEKALLEFEQLQQGKQTSQISPDA
ncbi:unnamed protein product [Phytophthora lilii]|uniref:Unnamed protein product n=1 Tax=Phytophthora lilii TaxID=2077276 RepID=A0A9W6X5R4_9STRA|nr:unnamed protein product [Phytophthora lilii]